MDASLLYQLLFLLPLVTAGIIAFFLRKQHNLAAGLSVISAAIFSAIGLYLIYVRPEGEFSLSWLSLSGGDGRTFELSFGVLFNDLSALMLLVLIIVGFLVQVFSLLSGQLIIGTATGVD